MLINSETGNVVDILESRERTDVAEWLKGFPDIKVFTRDGAGFYANAIRDAHPDALQVMDRFHILQHLTDCCKKYINRTVKSSEPIETENEAQDIPVFKTKYERITAAKEMKKQGMSVAEISDALFVSAVSVRNYLNLSEEQAEKYRKKTEKECKEERRSAKEELFWKIKELNEQHYTQIAIAKQLGITDNTVRKYLRLEEPPVLAYNSQREKSKLKPYMSKINELAQKGFKPKKIFEAIQSDGYSGSKGHLEKYISEQRKLRFAPPKKKVMRKALISLLYRNLENVNGLDEESLCTIIERYPELSELYGYVRSFRAMMFSKHYEQLEGWLNEAEKSDIPEIHSFITGVRQDFEATKAAIRYPYSNGVAEGNVTKIKLIKRSMFGRCSFDLLRAKVLLFSSDE